MNPLCSGHGTPNLKRRSRQLFFHDQITRNLSPGALKRIMIVRRLLIGRVGRALTDCTIGVKVATRSPRGPGPGNGSNGIPQP